MSMPGQLAERIDEDPGMISEMQLIGFGERMIYITYFATFKRLIDGDIELSATSHTDEEIFDVSHVNYT